eukprot:s3046_g3.t1
MDAPRGTYGPGLQALVAALVAAGALWRRASFAWQAALGDIRLRSVRQAWHLATSAFILCGRHGTYGTWLALVAALVAAGALWRRASFAWQAWHLATSAFDLCVALTALDWLWWRPWSPLVPCGTHLVCVVGVALGDIRFRSVWQAWHLATSAFVLCGRRGTYGTGLAPPSSCVVGVALGYIAFVLCGRRGTYGFGRRWCPAAPRLVCVAGVALGDIRFPSVWQAWRLATSAFVLCDRHGTYGTWLRRGTWRHPPSICVAGVALGDICLRFVWQAWHLRHWAGCGDGLGRRSCFGMC